MSGGALMDYNLPPSRCQGLDRQTAAKRNDNTAPTMCPLPAAALAWIAFIAVGAPHRPGKTGMPSLPAQESFHLTRAAQ